MRNGLNVLANDVENGDGVKSTNYYLVGFRGGKVSSLKTFQHPEELDQDLFGCDEAESISVPRSVMGLSAAVRQLPNINGLRVLTHEELERAGLFPVDDLEEVSKEGGDN